MKIRVKLLGTLPRQFPGYDIQQGLDIDISENASVQDLLDHIQIPDPDKCSVAVDGRVVKGNRAIKGITQVNIFRVAHGG